jgi:hypothetical protein
MAGFGRGGGAGSSAVQDTQVDPVVYDATTITGDAAMTAAVLAITAAAGALTTITSVVTAGTNYRVGDVYPVAGGSGGYVKITVTTATGAITIAVLCDASGTPQASVGTLYTTGNLTIGIHGPGIIQMAKGKTYRVDNSMGQVIFKVWSAPVLGEASRWIDINGSVTNFNPIKIDVGSDFWFSQSVGAPVELIQQQGSGAIKYMGALAGWCAIT